MKKFIVSIVLMISFFAAFAQTDTIFVKGNLQIHCSKIKEATEQYNFTYVTAENTKARSSILKYLVDSIKYFVPVKDSNVVVKNKQKKNSPDILQNTEPQKKQSPWHYTISVGANMESIIEFNNPFGTDKKSLSGSWAIDVGINYSKEASRFSMTNELHYIFGLQKPGFTSTDHLQRVTDNMNFLQDLSLAIGKTKKWNFNIIVKAATSFFTTYTGEYFKDYVGLGKEKAFLSPYDVTISPGIKWQPNKYLRVSISPYSFNLYGVKDQQVSSKGIYITDMDASGNYKKNLFKRLGAEVNFWYDRQVRKWLDVQYRLGVSSNYFEKIAKNGLMDGLFITRVKLIKDLYLTHRATIKGDFATSPFKPYYNQSILLSYSRSF